MNSSKDAAAGLPAASNDNRLAYTVPEAAALIGIGKSKLWEHISAGELPVCKWGGRTLVLKEDLLDTLRSHRVAA